METDVRAYIERLESIVQAGLNGLHQEIVSIKEELSSKIDAVSDRMLESAADSYFDSLESDDEPVDELVHSPINSMIK